MSQQEDLTVMHRYRMRLRAFTVADDEWFSALETASQRGEALSDVLRRALRDYAGAVPSHRPGRDETPELAATPTSDG